MSTQLFNLNIDEDTRDTQSAEKKEDIINIKGPMGKGLFLNEESDGHHFAFCAGTGILVFLDLVTFLILQNTKATTMGKFRGFKDSFVFHLFVAFRDRNESIGLEILEGL